MVVTGDLAVRVQVRRRAPADNASPHVLEDLVGVLHVGPRRTDLGLGVPLMRHGGAGLALSVPGDAAELRVAHPMAGQDSLSGRTVVEDAGARRVFAQHGNPQAGCQHQWLGNPIGPCREVDHARILGLALPVDRQRRQRLLDRRRIVGFAIALGREITFGVKGLAGNPKVRVNDDLRLRTGGTGQKQEQGTAH